MAITVQLFDRATKRQTACIPFASDDDNALGLAIATAKAQKDLAVVSNGKLKGVYLDGQLIEDERILRRVK